MQTTIQQQNINELRAMPFLIKRIKKARFTIKIQKFIQPKTKFHLKGDIYINFDILVQKYKNSFIFDIICSYKKITQAVYKNHKKVLCLNVINLNNNYDDAEFVIKRLESLGDKDAKRLSENIKTFLRILELQEKQFESIGLMRKENRESNQLLIDQKVADCIEQIQDECEQNPNYILQIKLYPRMEITKLHFDHKFLSLVSCNISEETISDILSQNRLNIDNMFVDAYDANFLSTIIEKYYIQTLSYLQNPSQNIIEEMQDIQVKIKDNSGQIFNCTLGLQAKMIIDPKFQVDSVGLFIGKFKTDKVVGNYSGDINTIEATIQHLVNDKQDDDNINYDRDAYFDLFYKKQENNSVIQEQRKNLIQAGFKLIQPPQNQIASFRNINYL